MKILLNRAIEVLQACGYECDELTDALADRDSKIVSLLEQNKQLKEALIKWRQREWPGTDQRSVVESEFMRADD